MRISKFIIDKETAQEKGLDEINLSRLGKVVALVGKNGSGKSRILELLKDYPKIIRTEDLLLEPLIDLSNDFKNYNNHIYQIKKLQIANENPVLDDFNRNHNNENLINATKNLNSIREGELFNLYKLSLKVIDNDIFKNKANILNKDNKNKEENLFENELSKEKPNIDNINFFQSISSWDYFQQLVKDIDINKLNSEDGQDDIDIEKNRKFDLLKDYINKFFNKELYYKRRRILKDDPYAVDITLNKFVFKFDDLSPGEKTLFAYCVMFFFQELNSSTNIKDSVIIFDEPEKHLHPDAQILLIDTLRRIIDEGTGQLWIATHSIHILAHLKYDEILKVADGKITSPKRRTPSESLSELLRLDNHKKELIDFLYSISEWEIANFFCDCLKEPDVKPFSSDDDKQVETFKSMIKYKKSIKLLDYGAGKGRIGFAISEDDELKEKIESYSVLENDKNNVKELEKVPEIKKIYSKSDDLPENEFDIVLMANVLHEIDPKEWVKDFKKIKDLINDDGYLIIIEDRKMPKGENAHEYGFLLLDYEQLEILFRSDDLIKLENKKNNGENRILCASIKKEIIDVTVFSVEKALENLIQEVLEKIKSQRKKINDNKEKAKIDLSFGRDYALYAQLYINAKMAYEDINNIDNKK